MATRPAGQAAHWPRVTLQDPPAASRAGLRMAARVNQIIRAVCGDKVKPGSQSMGQGQDHVQ